MCVPAGTGEWGEGAVCIGHEGNECSRKKQSQEKGQTDGTEELPGEQYTRESVRDSFTDGKLHMYMYIHVYPGAPLIRTSNKAQVFLLSQGVREEGWLSM